MKRPFRGLLPWAGSVLVLLGCLTSTPALAALDTPATTEARVIQEGADGLTLHITFAEPIRTVFDPPEGGSFLEVSVPGVMRAGNGTPGEPDLPLRGFPFGLPDDTEARVTSVRVLGSSSFQGPPPAPVPHRQWLPDEPPALEETYETDPAVYEGGSAFPATRVDLGPVRGWRHQRVQSLQVRPVQYNPSSGTYTAIREMEVDLRFEAGRPGPRTARRVPVGSDAPGWDEIIDSELVNPTSARTFRTRAAPERLSSQVEPGEIHMRIRLGGSGLCRLSFDALAARGWPAGVPVADVALEERGYDKSLSDPFVVTDLPRRVEDGNSNGIFDSGDFVMFYGFNYEDRYYNYSQNVSTVFANSRYSYFHTYWLSVAPNAGRDLPRVDGFPSGAYAAVDSFPSLVWEEQNDLYINNSPRLSNFLVPYNDNIFWFPPSYYDETTYFAAYDPDPNGTVRVQARWQGNDNVSQSYMHYVSLDLNGSTLINDEVLLYRDTYTSPVFTMPSAGTIRTGQNEVRIRGHSNQLANRTGAYFDWYKITYDRLLVARNDALLFNSAGRTGNLELAVAGFSSPEILLLDITDPVNIQEVDGRVEDAGGSYTLRFRVSVPGGATRRYAAFVPQMIQGLPPSAHPLPPDLGSDPIGLGLSRDLLAGGSGSDIILITHPDFASAWDPLIAHRESQGHRVFLCDVWEIYDQFSGGDKTPWAIQRFLTQAFRTWVPSPTYLVLGGDGSEDYRSDTDTSDPDWVPTMMIYGPVPGVAGQELSGSDEWYVAFLAEGDSEQDAIPDMIVGRIPAGSAAEAADFANKTIAYETMDPGDDWRQRGFFLADDKYSTGIYSDALQYCWKDPEKVFKETTQEVCQSIAVDGHLPEFESVQYFLADKLDTVATLYRNPGPGDCPVKPGGGAVLTDTRNYTRANLTRQVLNELKRGHLIWEYSGHGNKNLMTTESLIDNRPYTSATDIRKIDNIDKPFIFLGYACHLVEFEYYQEQTRGQSIGEEMLFSPGKGAVAVMASTGYEWLHTNEYAQRETTRSLFWDLPRDPDTGRPRRIFGEAMTRSFVRLALQGQGFEDMLRTYQNFGDPALRIDIRPAAFQVEVNGEDQADGTPLLADSFTDSLDVTAVISDDVDLSSIRVLDGTRELVGNNLHVTPPDPGDNGAQFYRVGFKTVLRLEGAPGVDSGTGAVTHSYDVSLEAVDWAGRAARFAFPVVFRTTFLALEPGGTRILLPNTVNTMEQVTPLRVVATSPVPLPESSVELTVDGEPVSLQAQPDSSGRVWTLEGGGPWAKGGHTAELHMRDERGHSIVSTVQFVTDPDVELLNSNAYGGKGVVFYPNPAEGGEGSLLYQLNRQAQRAEVTAYTVRGRRVFTADAPTRAGTNSFRWDLRDEIGDPVGNGVYLFLLRLWDVNGDVTTTDPQRVVVSR